MRHLAGGLSNKSIAGAAGIPEKTVCALDARVRRSEVKERA
ncbi:hypothetical protein [Variovorax sp. NFACC26]